MASAAHLLDPPPALEIDAALAGGCCKHPPPDWAAEERRGLGKLSKPVLVDLGRVDGDRIQLLVAEGAAVKEEAQTAGPGRARPQKVDASQPATFDVKAALLERLAPACLPRRLAGLLDLAARYRPLRLVVGLQDQQPAGLVEDQRTGRGGDPRDLPRRPGTGEWKQRQR